MLKFYRDSTQAIALGNLQYWAVGLDGLYQHKGSVWEKVLSNQDLSVRGWVQAVSQAVRDRVWLGTSAGLLSYQPDTKQLSTVSGHLSNADIRSVLAIVVDESELLLVGTSQGLYMGDSANWESVPDLENRTITTLALDSHGNVLWVGTDRGLFRLFVQDKSRKIDQFDVHNSGLAANRVIALAVNTDESGETKLWVGTPCGLSCYT
ncbi:MAG: two-component regulator propeller domain-containing protein [Scytonema sp. PMC 1070.18]|nr:two-component regulator propeller domain-containing protein [Scytonema sp. PMC 1070.18]